MQQIERLPRFEKPEDFKLRERWREDVDVKATPPVKIIGGYDFPKGMHLPCGLASCHAVHGLGFLTLLSDGTETHIGSYCGRTHLGAEWQALKDKFTLVKKAQAQIDVLEAALATRDQTLTAAQALKTRCEIAAEAVAEIRAMVEKSARLERAIESLVKTGGQLTYSRHATEDERAFNSATRTVSVKVGQMEGLAAFGKSGIAKMLQSSVIDHLEGFDASHLLTLKGKELDRHVRFIGGTSATLRRAEYFIRDAAKLVQRKNWDAFETYCRDSRLVRFEEREVEAFAGIRRVALSSAPAWAEAI